MIIKFRKGREKTGKLKQLLKKHLRTFSIREAGRLVYLETSDKKKLAEIIPFIEALSGVEKAEAENEELCPALFSARSWLKAGNFEIIAGPCALESEDSYLSQARALAALGVKTLRAPLFKPRRSPYTFQGLGEKAYETVRKARAELGVRTISEILSPEKAVEMSPFCDVFQIGARNMRNYELLKTLSSKGRKLLLKRAQGASLSEWLMAAEYVAAGGAEIVLCERGDAGAEGAERGINFNLALKAKKETGLPVIVDVSHSSGGRQFVPPLSLAACACGADGIMIEVHPEPELSLVDGGHALDLKNFEKLLSKLGKLRKIL